MTALSKAQPASSKRLPVQMLVAPAVVAAAAVSGLVAAIAGPSGVLICIGAIAAVPVFWLSIENLIGLWLVLALADPTLPRIGGLSFSDTLLVLALVKLTLRRRKLTRPPRQVVIVLSLAWLAEIVLMTFGHSVAPGNSRFLVTLAGLTAVVYVVWSSTNLTVWILWIAIASVVAAVTAIAQYAIYRATGVIIFPKAQNLFFVRTGISNVFKATGLGVDPNFLGMWMVSGVGIGLIGVFRTKRRILFGSLILLCAVGTLVTGSRGTLISVVIGGAIVCLLEASSPRRRVDTRILRFVGLLLIAAVVTPFLAGAISRAIARYPVTAHIRAEQIPLVLHDAVSGNWTGRGYEALLPQAADAGVSKPFLSSENIVHNTIMEALFEAGWLGFLVPLLMIFSGLKMALHMIRRGTFEAAMLGAAFVILAVNLQTLGAYAFRPLWFLWALLLAVGSTVTYSPPSSIPRRRVVKGSGKYTTATASPRRPRYSTHSSAVRR
jgi:hypothetical protein